MNLGTRQSKKVFTNEADLHKALGHSRYPLQTSLNYSIGMEARSALSQQCKAAEVIITGFQSGLVQLDLAILQVPIEVIVAVQWRVIIMLIKFVG